MHELLVQVIFYLFAGLTVLSALMVVMQTNPVRCVLFLVFSFLASAVLWILVEAEFLALILVLVYVGAVMTLFLFVVMMLNIDTESKGTRLAKHLPFALILVALITGITFFAIPQGIFKTKAPQPIGITQVNGIVNNEDRVVDKRSLGNTEQIGLVLYTDYAFAFEIAAVLLLVAIVSAITLAHRGLIRSKRQNILSQIMTRREDRVELIKMQPEN